MATDHNFKVKNGLHVEGANTKIVDAGSGNVKLEAGGTLSIRPEGTTSNKHLFELNDYTAAGTIQGANLTATSTVTAAGLLFANGGDRSITGPQNEDLIINARPNDTTEGLHLQINGTDRILVKQDGNVTVANNLTIGGSLTVNGSTTTIDTATLQVEDKNITVNYSTGDSSSTADGAGITIQDAVNSSTDASLTWDATNDFFLFSHGVKIPDRITHAGDADTEIVFATNDVKIKAGGATHFHASSDQKTQLMSGNATTMVLDTSQRVGIGTTAPQSKFETNLHSGADSSLMNANSVNDVHLIRAGFGQNAATTSNAGAKWGLRFVGRNDGTYDTGKSGAIFGVSEDSAGYNRKVGLAFHTSPFDGAHTERMRIDNVGNVGINEDSVDMKLHISDSTTPGIKFERPGVAAWRAGVTGTSFQISDSSDTLASPELVLTNSGRLQINHDALALAAQPAIVAQFDSTGTDGLALIQVQHLTASGASALGAGITFKVGDGTSGSATKSSYIYQRGAGQTTMNYVADRNHQFYVDHHDNDLTGTTYSDIGTLAMDIQENGQLKLYYAPIIQSPTPKVTFIETDSSNKTFEIGSFGGAFAVYDSGANKFRYIIDGSGNHVFNEAGDSLDFRVESNTNAHMLFVDGSADRVGIGNSSPSVALDVVGAANFYSGTTSNTLNIGRNATERLKIDVTDGDITLTADQDADGNSTHNFILDRTFDGSGASQFQIKNNGSLQFNMSATDNHFYNETTYMGVNDSVPASLHLFGGAAGNAEGGELRLYTSADHDSSHEWFRIDAYQDDLRIGRAGNTDIYLFQNGSVKIENNNLILNHDLDMANNKDINFFNASGVDDGTKILRAGGNALRVKYAANALIFDALDNTTARFYNSGGDNIFQVNPNSTASSSTVDIVNGNLRMGSTSVITSARVLQNVTTNASILTAGTVPSARVSGDYSIRSTSTSGQLKAKDDRIIEPNSINSQSLQFGFTSFDNDNGSPYADYLHLRSYGDSTGGSDNLVMFSKSSIAGRVYQQSWNSSTAYSSYKNIVMTDTSSNNVTLAGTLTTTGDITSADRIISKESAGGFYKLHTDGTFRAAFYDDNSNTAIYADGDGSNPFITFSGGSTHTTDIDGILTISGDVNIGASNVSGTHALKVYHTDNFEAAKFQTNTGGALARFTDTAASVEFGVQSGNAVIRTANTSRIKINSSGVITFNSVYAFPTADGSSGQVLKTDGSGNLTFQNDTSATFTGGDVASAINFTPDTGTFLSVDGQAILQRMTANGALTIGHDDHVIIAGGDTSGVLNTNLTNANEEVTLGSEGGVRMLAFPSNNTSWSNRKELKWDGTNGLQILNSMPLKMGSDIVLDSTHGFSSATSDGKFYAWSPVSNTSSQTNNYIKIATLSIGQSARFSIELQGKSTSYGDGQFPAWGKLVGQLNNDDAIDATFYDFTSGQNSDASKVVNNIYHKKISSTSHEIWIHVDAFSEIGATASVSTGTITVHSNNTGQTTSAPASIVTVTKIEMWNSNNDGSGSGLNADTLDGVSSEEFLRSNQSDSSVGNMNFTGSGSTGNAFRIQRGANTQQEAFRVNNTGEVVVSNNYLYAASTGTAFYSQGSAVFRGGIRNDTTDEPLWINDDLNVGATDSNKVTTLFVGSDAVTTDNSGLRFRLNGTYADGRYEHRFRKRDEGGGIPLYIDKTEGTAGSHTAIARFGLYSGHGDEFEVYGGGKMTRLTTADGINDAGSAGSATIFNENGTTADFRIESDSNTHMFFLDGGLNRIGINNSSPSTTLDVTGDTTITGELNITNKLRHVGDTNTYLQFHAADQIRTVAGNTEITEWRSDRMQMTNKPITFSNWSNFSDDALTDINYATLNAPIHIPAVNIGTNNKYLPILQGSAQHTQGYRSSFVFGAYKKGTTGAAWGDGQTGFFMGMGGNDNHPTKEFRFSWDGRIWYTDAGDDTWIDFDTDSHIKFVTSGVHRGEFDDGGINIVSGGYQTSGTTRIDTAGKFFPASLNSTGKISVLNGSSAQGIRVSALYAGTTYANDNAASGMVDALNGYRVAGTQRIDSSGNFFASDYINIGDDATIEDMDVANTIRVKGQQANTQGYIAFGQQTAKLGVNNSSTLTYNSNFAVTGNITSTATIQCGTGSGGVGLTVNDGQGNANVTFNHVAGIPEQAGNCGRIVVNTDSTTGAQMNFELASNSGTSVINTPSAMNLTETGLHIAQYLYHLSDTDTYVRMTGDRIRIAAGGVVKFDTNTFNTFNALVVGGGNSNASIYRDGSYSGFHFTTNAIYATGGDGQLNNGVVDLGSTSYRYKDIHLNGSAYLGSRLYLSGQTAVDLSVDSGYFEVTTASGYVRMGAGNTSYAHFHTDRAQFYFNRKLVVNEGIITSYDEDLILRRASSSNDQITLTGTEVKFANGYNLRMYDSSGTSNGSIHIPREGAISFYGDTSMNHSIGARNTDDIRLNTYGAFEVNLDSNGNNSSGADFLVARHGGATSAYSTSDKLFKVDGETGAVTAKNDVTAFGSFSDRRLKENIKTIDKPIEKVMTLSGVTFNYIDSGEKSTGLIAQDLEEVLPEAVYETHKLEDEETTVKAIRYGNTVGLLVEAIKEQQTIINRLEERINKLEGENNGD